MDMEEEVECEHGYGGVGRVEEEEDDLALHVAHTEGSLRGAVGDREVRPAGSRGTPPIRRWRTRVGLRRGPPDGRWRRVRVATSRTAARPRTLRTLLPACKGVGCGRVWCGWRGGGSHTAQPPREYNAVYRPRSDGCRCSTEESDLMVGCVSSTSSKGGPRLAHTVAYRRGGGGRRTARRRRR